MAKIATVSVGEERVVREGIGGTKEKSRIDQYMVLWWEASVLR